MNMPLTQRVEIYFWDVVINLLSQSPLVRSIVKNLANQKTRMEVLAGVMLVAAGGMIGLLLGVLLPVALR